MDNFALELKGVTKQFGEKVIANDNGTLITQNVDGLDKKAGNKHVIEFHGDLYNIYCTKCHEKISYDSYKKSYLHEKDQGIVRPGIVLYGEPINEKVLTKSVKNIHDSDVVIITGTSFVVYPFAQLLAYRQANAKIWGTKMGSSNIISIRVPNSALSHSSVTYFPRLDAIGAAYYFSDLAYLNSVLR